MDRIMTFFVLFRKKEKIIVIGSGWTLGWTFGWTPDT